MSDKGHNLRHKNSLRTKAEIQTELNQKLFELGNIEANIVLLGEQREALLPKIRVLAKEQSRPEKEAPKQDEPIEDQKNTDIIPDQVGDHDYTPENLPSDEYRSPTP